MEEPRAIGLRGRKARVEPNAATTFFVARALLSCVCVCVLNHDITHNDFSAMTL